MNDSEFNLGILIGGAAAVLSVLAALAALYLWAVNRTRQKLDLTLDPQTRAVGPWLAPLFLPTLVILCLGFIKALWQAYEEKSWPEVSLILFTAWPAFFIFILRQRIQKKLSERCKAGIAPKPGIPLCRVASIKLGVAPCIA